MESDTMKLGSSLKVPYVQELVKEKLASIPPRYIRSDPTKIDGVASNEIPVVDMQGLLSEESVNTELEKLHFACKEWGFFQNWINIWVRHFQYAVSTTRFQYPLSFPSQFSSTYQAVAKVDACFVEGKLGEEEEEKKLTVLAEEDELNRRVEEFIARVNRQRRLEESQVVDLW